MTNGINPDKQGQPALLLLESGAYIMGTSCGAAGEAFGEICFNTAMIGYPEIITDPASAGLIVCMTYPQIGNYGLAYADLESDSATLRGLVVRDIDATPSNFRSDISLPDYLAAQGVVAITGVDTRALTRYLRERGSMRAVITTLTDDPAALLPRLKAAATLGEQELIPIVSCQSPYLYSADAADTTWTGPLAEPRYKVIALDLGLARSTLSDLARLGCAVIVVPWDTPAKELMSYQPHGVLLAGGPGDAQAAAASIRTAAELMGKLPLFGVGIGHLVMALAVGGEAERLKTGHHGASHPVYDLAADRVSFPLQNHGFTLKLESLGTMFGDIGDGAIASNPVCGRVQLTEINLNDDSVEGLRYLDIAAASVQYQPRLAPGQTEADGPYAVFLEMMDKYLSELASLSSISELINNLSEA